MRAKGNIMSSTASAQLKSNRSGPQSAPPHDLVATYMGHLSESQLLSADEEKRIAKNLINAEINTWGILLALPRAVQLLFIDTQEIDEKVFKHIKKLHESYHRSAQRNPNVRVKINSTRLKQIKKISKLMRTTDQDQELLGNLVQRLEREIWSKRNRNRKPIFQLEYQDIEPLIGAYYEAQKIKNAFVKSNLRLVVSVARKYLRSGVPLLDLVQEGNMGLLKAVERFDPKKGFRFSTYAHWWIRQSVERSIINRGSQIRLPVHVIDARRQVAKAVHKLTQRWGRKPTSGELARSLKIPKARVEEILNGVHQDPISLDEPLGRQDSRSHNDILADPNARPIDEEIEDKQTHQQVYELLNYLTPMEKDILLRRFGLVDDCDQTLEEIGEAYNLSRERVRQIQVQSLTKMKRMCIVNKIVS